MPTKAPSICPTCGRRTKAGRACPCGRASRTSSSSARGYGTAHQRRRLELIEAEPWCHRATLGQPCRHRDAGTKANPLTLHHLDPLATTGGRDTGRHLILCRRCNTELGDTITIDRDGEGLSNL